MPLDGVLEQLDVLHGAQSLWADAPDAGGDAPADAGFSPGLGFEARLAFRPDMAAALEAELSRPGYTPRPVVLGCDTDPYQPVERTLRLTRAVLEVMERFGHPVSVVTKSAAVLRDLDILQRLAARGLVRVWFSVATLDAALARRMEPRAAAPARRLHTIAALSGAGVPAGVLAAPMVPGLNDAEMERILEAGARAGARHAGYVLLRLPQELRDAFAAWLHEQFPDRARQVLALIRETRAEALRDGGGRHGFPGAGSYPDVLAQRFARATRRLHLEPRNTLDATRFAPPALKAEAEAELQLSLF